MKPLVIGSVWLISLLALLLIYPSVGSWAIEHVPYSFLILAPFGLDSFFEWTLVFAISYWAIHALSWDESPVRKMAKWLVGGAVCIVLLHAAWVIFVVAKGGI